jgi:hypothetical protein
MVKRRHKPISDSEIDYPQPSPPQRKGGITTSLTVKLLTGDTKFTPGGTQTTLSAVESRLARGGADSADSGQAFRLKADSESGRSRTAFR